MKLTLRQVKLLQGLNEYPEITMKDFGNILNISVRTIKTELHNMTEMLSLYKISVEQSSGKQILVRGSENLTQMLKATKNRLEFSLEQQTMLILLMSDDFVILQDLADALFVSKSSIEKLMSGLLKKYPDELQSLRHYGIRCTLSQLERRSLFAKLLLLYFRGIDFKKELEQFHLLHFPLLKYFSQQDIAQSISMLTVMQETKNFSFTDESVCQLFLCFLFLVRHHRKEHKGRIGAAFVDLVNGCSSVHMYRAVAQKLVNIAGIASDQNEISYICYLLMTLRKQKILDTQEIIMEMKELVEEILDVILKRLSIDLFNDMDLFNGLALHIYATVLRKDMLKLLTVDYSLADTRIQYPLSFEMAVIVSQIIKSKYHYAVAEEEMIYLTLHFQAAIERMKSNEPKIRIVIVCHYGMAASSLIETKVNRLFNAIQIVGSYSIHTFLQLKELNCDLVLTTEKIPACTVPLIYITPVLGENELKMISDFIETKCINKMLERIITDSTILHLKGEKSVERILSVAIEELQKGNYVSEAYFNSVMERERISSTDIGYFAIPHGNADFVKETKLLIVKLDKPILWKVSLVKYVFLLAISQEQFRDNFSLFFTFYKKLVKSNMKEKAKDFDAFTDHEFKHRLVHLLNS